MSPLKRELYDNAVYHIVQRGNNKQVIFRDDDDYRQFLFSFSKYNFRYQFALYHYCLMPNHIHFLIKIPDKEAAPKLMQGLLQSFRFYYRKKYGYVGYLFQGRYRSKIIEQDSYLLECARYIERNPIRAGLVNNLEDYKWSSFRFYYKGYLNDLLTENPLFASFGQNLGNRREAYKQYLLLPRLYEELLDKGLKLK